MTPLSAAELIEEQIPEAGIRRPETLNREADLLSRLLPRIIGLLLVLDMALRFLPSHVFSFRAWECMTRYQHPGSIFQANARFEKERTYGNLANLANLPLLRQYRPQRFTTDAAGFRNLPSTGDGKPAALFVGDSFLAGDAVSDEETLTAQLGARTGLQFYNAGGPYAYAATARMLKAKLGLKQVRLIIVQTEGVSGSMLQEAEAKAQGDRKTEALRVIAGERGDQFRSWLRGWWYVSPLRIMLQRGYRALSNNRILPNVYSGNAVIRKLRSGQTMLFYPPEIEDDWMGRDMTDVAAHLSRLSRALKEEEFDVSVVLVPGKYSVYQSLLAGTDAKAAPVKHPHAQLQELLISSGIKALDLTSQMQACAVSQARSGKYLYWFDDTHWNRNGIAVAARAIEQAWFQTDAKQAARDICTGLPA